MKKYAMPDLVCFPFLHILAIMLLVIPSFGQDIAKKVVIWEAEEVTDLQTGTTTEMACQFITTTNNSVEWVQRKGALKTTYAIASFEGKWPNISQSGSITYYLKRGGKNCNMSIERTGADTFITMDFSQKNEFTSRLKFKIKSVR